MREFRIWNRESGVGSRESGVGNREEVSKTTSSGFPHYSTQLIIAG
ncbi:MAG: hypothetical protein F6K56_31420 [Moorea sp. SIO3G5]|nr:hypothetical protein [Moorena sp. SIO3G5]